MTTLGLFHTATGIAALVTGALIFFTTKGTRVHRIIGYVYFASMLLLNVSALMIYRVFGGFGPFHVLALASLVSLWRGFAPAYQKRPEAQWLARHYEGVGWSYIGLLAATAAEIASRGPWVRGFGIAFGLSVFVASVVVSLAGAIVLYRYRVQTLGRVAARLTDRSS